MCDHEAIHLEYTPPGPFTKPAVIATCTQCNQGIGFTFSSTITGNPLDQEGATAYYQDAFRKYAAMVEAK